MRSLFILLIYLSVPPWAYSLPEGGPPLPSLCAETLHRLQPEGDGVLGITVFPEVAGVPKISDYEFKGQLFPMPIRNQCAYGSCWGAVGNTAPEIAAYENGVNVELSLDYTIATKLIDTFGLHLKEFVRPRLKTPQRLFVEDGGTVWDAFRVMRKYGFVPASAWESKRKFGQNKVEDLRLMNSLKALQSKFYSEVDSLRKMYQEIKKTPTNDVFIRTTSDYVKKIEEIESQVRLMRLGLKSIDDAPLRFEDLNRLNKLIEDYEARAWTLLVAYLGKPPETFLFEGELFNPLSFSKLPIFEYDMWTKASQLYKNIKRPTESSFEAIKSLLENRELIPVSLKTGTGFSDSTLGIYSVDMFNIVGLSRDKYVESTVANSPSGNHAIQVVDYLERQSGEKWLLLKNTWGEKSGDSGYFHINWESFVELLNGIYLQEKYNSIW